MKGYFITWDGMSTEDKNGISRKIKDQIMVFSEAGLQCEEHKLEVDKGIKLKLLYRFPFYNGYPKWEYHEKFAEADYIYFRRPLIMSGYMLKMVKRIKKNNPRCKIILEIPTYPYDEELRGYKMSAIILAKDRTNRKKLFKYIDRVTVISNTIYRKGIFGVPTISFINGVDVRKISIRTPVESNAEDIFICAIAVAAPWHGYERVIRGLKKYYDTGGKRNITILFAGSSEEMTMYKALTKELGLTQHTRFLGYCDGEQLEEVYNRCDLALDCFGAYKKNLRVSSSLKTRNYLAKGLPIVSGCPLDVMSRPSVFFLEFPNNDSDVSFEEIVRFYDNLYKGKKKRDVARCIRETHEDSIDIRSTMKGIIEYIKS